MYPLIKLEEVEIYIENTIELKRGNYEKQTNYIFS
jgi:hypothetical protein